MSGNALRFEPIDLSRHADLCVRFRIDSYVCSLGSSEKFYEHNETVQGYIDWLRKRMQELPGSCVHLWKGDGIIGQLEMGRYRTIPEMGYVNLYYLVPEARGTGISHRLDDYVRQFYSALALKQARLNVSPTNERAIRYYEKQGWQNLGPDPRHPEMLVFERTFGPA